MHMELHEFIIIVFGVGIFILFFMPVLFNGMTGYDSVTIVNDNVDELKSCEQVVKNKDVEIEALTNKFNKQCPDYWLYSWANGIFVGFLLTFGFIEGVLRPLVKNHRERKARNKQKIIDEYKKTEEKCPKK